MSQGTIGYLTKDRAVFLPSKLQRLNRKHLIWLLFAVVALVLMRFDFVYSGKKMEVARGNTLSEYLNTHVFHHAGITNTSIVYLRDSGVAVDLVLANKNSEGGDRVTVRGNKLVIMGPNDQVRVQHQVLPDRALRNHQLQVIVYDLLVVSLCFYLGVLLNDFLKIRDRKIIYQQVGIVLIVVFVLPMTLILLLGIVANIYRFYLFKSNPTPAGSVPSYQLQQINEASPEDIQIEVTYSPQLTPYEIQR